MKRVVLLVVLSTFLFSNSVVELYRKSGIKAVESYIQEKLQDKNYWKEYLKDVDVTFGYYENIKFLLIANKEKKELGIYKAENNLVELITTYKNVIVGANGDKQKEGDLKTPLGVYEITQKFTPPDPFYGPLAFVLSYPNTYDKVQGKNGYGIWIHGSPLDGSPRDPMSKGCIVLDNDTIELLDKTINPKKSIVIVSETKTPEVSKDEISLILSELFKWKSFWKENRLNEYLNFYAPDFKRFDKMGKKQFARMKKMIFSKKQSKSIVFKDINISPYPNEEGKKLFKIAFYEIYKSKTYKFRGNKELFIELKNDTFSILSEK